jgi:hypothetical protein
MLTSGVASPFLAALLGRYTEARVAELLDAPPS